MTNEQEKHINGLLIYCKAMFPGFLIFPGGIKRVHWTIMGYIALSNLSVQIITVRCTTGINL